jgi:hypothetical protein
VTTREVPGSPEYAGVTGLPQDGDIILFDGHMGIVFDAAKEVFIGAQSHGVDNASYAKGSYWGGRHHTFYRYVGP